MRNEIVFLSFLELGLFQDLLFSIFISLILFIELFDFDNASLQSVRVYVALENILKLMISKSCMKRVIAFNVERSDGHKYLNVGFVRRSRDFLCVYVYGKVKIGKIVVVLLCNKIYVATTYIAMRHSAKIHALIK